MHYRYISLLLFTALMLTFTSSFAAPPAAPIVAAPQAKDKCPVCGMFVSKYPDWIVSVALKDSTTVHFDGAKDFFTWYHNLPKYAPGKKQSDITAISVIDYYTLKPTDARKAHFVMGSDVYGPMGKELVPFTKLADAYAFLKDHKGKMVLRFTDVTPKVLKALE